MPKADFVSIRDLDPGAMTRILDLAADLRAERVRFPSFEKKILATLFYEPSTRTRMSFESAMHRLGGRVITMADAKSSSAVKGESLADATRIVGAYADAIVIRHPFAGAAAVAAEASRVPVVNAGDGGHEHPSQTLTDLFTLREKTGRLEGLKVLLYGDLKFGRTTHSLADALIRVGAEVYGLAEPGFELPEYVIERCQDAGATRAVCAIDDPFFGRDRKITVLCRDRRRVQDLAECAAAMPAVDAVYVTRLQRERLGEAGYVRDVSLPRVDQAFLDQAAFATAMILHPLPRVGEIDPRIDVDPRAAFFDQAQNGVPVRMAILAALLDPDNARVAWPSRSSGTEVLADARCSMPQCIAASEPHAVRPRWIAAPHGTRRCAYCETLAY